MLRSKLNTFKKYLERLADLFSKPIVRKVIIITFVLQCIYIALTFRFGVPPDELTHIGFIEFYANNSLSPIIDSQADKFVFGEMTRDPSYLYHYLMSLVYRVLPLPIVWKYFVIRLFSVVAATLTIIASVKLAKRLKISDASINVGLLIVTSLSQFMMMSSVVNNDAMIWLVSSLTLLCLFELSRTKNINYLLASGILVLIGSLTKKTFLPLGLFFGIVGLVLLIGNYKKILQKDRFKNWLSVALLAVLVIVFGLFAERILVNVFRYKSIDPNCDKIHSVEECRDFGIYGRNEYFIKIRPDNPALLSFPSFVSYWYFQSVDSTVDIDTQFWSHDTRPPYIVTTLIGLLAAFGFWQMLAFSFKYRNTRDSKTYFVFVGAVTTIVIANLVLNYQLYHLYARLGFATHGRYLFAVIVPFCIVASWFIAKSFRSRKYLASILAIAVCGLAVTQTGLLFLLRHPQFTKDPLRPAIIFDVDNAIKGPSPEADNLNR